MTKKNFSPLHVPEVKYRERQAGWEEGNTVGFAFVVHVWQKLITALISIWNIIVVVVVVGFCLYLHGCYYYSGLLLGWLGGGFHQSVYLRQDIQTDRQSFDNPVRICFVWQTNPLKSSWRFIPSTRSFIGLTQVTPQSKAHLFVVIPFFKSPLWYWSGWSIECLYLRLAW